MTVNRRVCSPCPLCCSWFGFWFCVFFWVCGFVFSFPFFFFPFPFLLGQAMSMSVVVRRRWGVCLFQGVFRDGRVWTQPAGVSGRRGRCAACSRCAQGGRSGVGEWRWAGSVQHEMPRLQLRLVLKKKKKKNIFKIKYGTFICDVFWSSSL